MTKVRESFRALIFPLDVFSYCTNRQARMFAHFLWEAHFQPLIGCKHYSKVTNDCSLCLTLPRSEQGDWFGLCTRRRFYSLNLINGGLLSKTPKLHLHPDPGRTLLHSLSKKTPTPSVILPDVLHSVAALRLKLCKAKVDAWLSVAARWMQQRPALLFLCIFF